MARRDPVGIRLITRRGNDWSDRFPLVVEAVVQEPRSCEPCSAGAQLVGNTVCPAPGARQEI
jgi:ATP-dependent DNA ligase